MFQSLWHKDYGPVCFSFCWLLQVRSQKLKQTTSC
uniref:Uncharacterized protein n=1 Tax=Arundo donax TaxID=35708 RepID=A0A0A8YH59_ARUDO